MILCSACSFFYREKERRINKNRKREKKMIYLEPLQVRASKRNLLLFKLFSSPELKAQVSFSDNFLSVVCLSTFHIFIFFSRTTGSISTKLGTKHAWVVVIQVCLNEKPHPSISGYNIEIVKCDLRLFQQKTYGGQDGSQYFFLDGLWYLGRIYLYGWWCFVNIY